MNSDNPVYIVDAKWTMAPCSKPGNPEKGLKRLPGPFDSLSAVQLGAYVAEKIVSGLPNFSPDKLEGIYLGCANTAGEQNGNPARLMALYNGWKTTPGFTVNQLCMSSVEAQILAASVLCGGKTGSAKGPRVILVGGVEMMSHEKLISIFDDLSADVITKVGPLSCNMGLTAELLAQNYNLTREDIDRWAMTENERVRTALQNGWFDDQFVPVHIRDVHVDSFPMPSVLTIETVGQKSKLPFDTKGMITNFGSSNEDDAASFIVMCNKEALDAYGWKPIAAFIHGSTGTTEPEIMGKGAITAVEQLIAETGLNIQLVPLCEVNTAFASVPLSFAKHFGISQDHINVCGGATSLGHPLGATGTRLTATAISASRRLRYNQCVITMCVGFGQGGACWYHVFPKEGGYL